MCAHGLVGDQPIQFLIDSGAAVSVISYHILSSSARKEMTKTAPLTVGANSLPLDVLGSESLEVNLDSSSASHVFIVAKKLTVDCLIRHRFLV